MVAPNHYRLTFSGTFGDASTVLEEWSFGLSLSGVTPTPADPFLTRAQLVTAAASLRQSWSSLTAQMGSGTRLRRCRVSSLREEAGRLVTGRDADGAYFQGDWVGDIAATGSSVFKYPPQITIAASLQSAASGPTGKGRFFLPNPMANVGADGRMSSTDATTVANAVKAFVADINTRWAAVAPGGQVVIASAGSAGRGIPPALRPVVSVNVGRAFDTQRRRRADLLERDRIVVPL